MFQRLSKLSAVCLGLFCSTAVALPVGYDWKEWPVAQGGNGHFYALTETSGPNNNGVGSWSEAEAEAVAIGWDLVTINDANEQGWLSTTFPYGEPFHPWIGLWQDLNDPNYSEPGGGWKWINGEDSAFRNWAGGEPNEAPPPETNEDRAQMNAFAAGLWQDVPGDSNFQRGIIETPEPATLSLLSLGGLAMIRQRRLR